MKEFKSLSKEELVQLKEELEQQATPIIKNIHTQINCRQ